MRQNFTQPAPSKPDVLIVNYHSCADTLCAVAALESGSHGIIWIIDNSEDPGEAQALQKAVRGRNDVKVVIAESNLGFGRACNRLFEASSSPLLLLLNPDARIGPDDVRRLAEAMDGSPHLGAASPRIFWDQDRTFLLPAAFPQSPCVSIAMAIGHRFRTLAQWTATRRMRRMHHLMTSPDPVTVDFLAGAILMVRRDAVKAVGGLFDNEYFMFFEDADLSIRLRRGGYQLKVITSAAAEHAYRHKPFKASLMDQSRKIFFRKCFPLFYRLSGELRGLDRLFVSRRHPTRLIANACNVDEFNRLSKGASLIAFSPSPLAMPAAFRCDHNRLSQMDEATWHLLESGVYQFCLATGDRRHLRWIEVNVCKANN